MAEFKNPNNPQQPCPGIYRWYAVKDEKVVTLYIGSCPVMNSIKETRLV